LQRRLRLSKLENTITVSTAIENALKRMKLQGDTRIEQGRELGGVPMPLAEEILGVSRARIYVLASKGRLEFVKSKGKDRYTYVTMNSLEKFMEERNLWQEAVNERPEKKAAYVPTGRPRGRPRKVKATES
jgi:hypothetical protein